MHSPAPNPNSTANPLTLTLTPDLNPILSSTLNPGFKHTFKTGGLAKMSSLSKKSSFCVCA